MSKQHKLCPRTALLVYAEITNYDCASEFAICDVSLAIQGICNEDNCNHNALNVGPLVKLVASCFNFYHFV